MSKKNAATRAAIIGEMTVELFNIPLFVETPIVNTDLLENQRSYWEKGKQNTKRCVYGENPYYC